MRKIELVRMLSYVMSSCEKDELRALRDKLPLDMPEIWETAVAIIRRVPSILFLKAPEVHRPSVRLSQ